MSAIYEPVVAKEEGEVLFMTIYTYEPENREAVIKRRAGGAMAPPGVKIVGEWSSVMGGRVFRLIEADDPKALLAGTAAWADLGRIEAYPVMPTEEVMKLLTAKK